MRRGWTGFAIALAAALTLSVADAAAEAGRPEPDSGRKALPESPPPEVPKGPVAPTRPQPPEGDARGPAQPGCPYFERKLELIV